MRRRGRFDSFTAYGVFYILFLYGPVVLMPIFSFNDSIYIAFPLKGFTTQWYEQMVENTSLVRAFWNSLKIGIPVAIISTILGMLAAKAVTRYRMPGRGPISGLIMLPLVIPEIILCIALLNIVRKGLDLDLSLYTIAASHVLLCVPYSMLVLVSRLEGFDKSLEEASLDLGENAWTTFWRVTFPLTLPGIVASLLVTFIVSFDEFLLAFFLSGSEATLPLFIWSQLRFPNKLPGVLALGCCILAASFALVIFAEWLRRRGAPAKQSGALRA
jgi:spermidine/putrescine transport system permease protein